MSNVEISVIMSVFNTKEEYLCKSIESILNQTYRNFEFIIVNDGCNEKTQNILDYYADKDTRIKLIHNEKNIGLTKSLNKAIKIAQGKYIARMDADDISYDKRFRRQYDYMEKYKNTDILGCWTYDGVEVCKYGGNMPMAYRRVKMLFGNSGVAHPTAFIRRSFLKNNNICYDEQIEKSQDYQYWADCISNGAVISVYPGVLFYYRRHETQISNDVSGRQSQCAHKIQEKIVKQLYKDISEKSLLQLQDMTEERLSILEFNMLSRQLEKCNKTEKVYEPNYLHQELLYQRSKLYKKYTFNYCIYCVKRFLWKRIWN